MSNIILDFLLYNQTNKKIVNCFLNSQIFLQNPLYRFFQKNQIEKTIKKNETIPFALRIENTNVCNSRCFMCPHSSMKRKQGFMDFKLYRKLIDEASQWGIKKMTIHNFGEPLLDKNFIKEVKYAKLKKIAWVSTNTNGMVMDEDLSKQLINSELDELFVSLDAASELVYKKVRAGLDFKKVCLNIEYLARLKKNLSVSHPKIIVDFLESDLNRHEINIFIARWKKLTDRVCISQAHDWSSRKKNSVRFPYQNYVSFSQAPCRLPFTEISINWDGTVSLCCQDIEGEMIIGDAKKQSLQEIWHGNKLKRLREEQLSLTVERLPLCGKCKLRTFWWTF